MIARWRAQNFDDFDKLINARITRENGLSKQQLGQDAASRPDINLTGVVSGAKDQLGRAVVSAAYVRDVWLALDVKS